VGARRVSGRASDDLWGELDVRKVQPYQAVKVYLCPGCHGDIPTGMGHLVVVPLASPADRRHWHEPCFRHRRERR
jgi:hypothetical protein